MEGHTHTEGHTKGHTHEEGHTHGIKNVPVVVFFEFRFHRFCNPKGNLTNVIRPERVVCSQITIFSFSICSFGLYFFPSRLGDKDLRLCLNLVPGSDLLG